MKILFASSECAPFSKSGGLADVAFSLPPALKKTGDEIACITPLYKCVKDKYMDTLKRETSFTVKIGSSEQYVGLLRGENNGVTMWFVENDMLFDRPMLYGYNDDGYRFAYFSRAVIDSLTRLDFMPEIIHCNDWETAPLIIYLKNDQVWRDDLRHIRTVYTIHNIAYQGQYGAKELYNTFGLPDGWYKGGLGFEYKGRHDINFMKGAMLMADAVSTVSPTYAKELHYPEFGMGLQGVADMVEYKTYGILNGIDMDHYDPSKDERLPFNFSVDDMLGKAKCKAYIQEKFGLKKRANWPLLAQVARLNEQKGIELIKEVLPGIMDMGVQLIVFGQGEQKYIDYFNWAKQKWPGQLGFSCDYTEAVASEIFAGADMYLMPSRFEPCGLSQMMAMRMGTIPIVHETGGLKDSVRPYSNFDGMGDGFSFPNYNSKSLYMAILQAVREYYGEPEVWETLRRRCMTKDFSWDKSAGLYNRMYGEIFDGGEGEPIAFAEAYETLSSTFEKLYRKNLVIHQDNMDDDYHLAVGIQITGRGAGVFYVELTKYDFASAPYHYDGADAMIAASYDNLLGMANGTVNFDRLFMNGQLKVEGNVARAAELRKLFFVGTEDEAIDIWMPREGRSRRETRAKISAKRAAQKAAEEAKAEEEAKAKEAEEKAKATAKEAKPADKPKAKSAGAKAASTKASSTKATGAKSTTAKDKKKS